MIDEEEYEYSEETSDEEDIESEEGREKLLEDDAISPAEQGFMEGAEGDGQGAKCRNCGKVLKDDFVERKVKGELYRFCSDECEEKYMEKHQE